jgi:hypothetical protein
MTGVLDVCSSLAINPICALKFNTSPLISEVASGWKVFSVGKPRMFLQQANSPCP